MKDIGSSIQRLRETKGYTQEQLAEKLFVSRQTVSNYERNKSQPSLEMLSRIAEVFDTDVASLLWAAVGYFLLSVIVTAARIHWKKKTWHNVVFAVVIAVAALYLIAMSPFLFSYEIPGAWSRFLYWILGATPGHPFPQAYLVLAFISGATLRICRPGVGSSMRFLTLPGSGSGHPGGRPG